jgi:hypothetical protein
MKAFSFLSQKDNENKNDMDLRDYFAGQSLESFFSVNCDTTRGEMKEYAQTCYDMADAMLEARKK